MSGDIPEADSRMSELARNISWELDIGLPVANTAEYELLALMEGDERTLLELSHDIPELARLSERLSESGEDGPAWNLWNAFFGA